MFEFQSDPGKGLLVVAFIAAAVFFAVFTVSPISALLGTLIVGLVLLALYYAGVRVDTWARGGRR